MPRKKADIWAIWLLAVMVILSLSITLMVDRVRYLDYQNSQGKASRNLPSREVETHE